MKYGKFESMMHPVRIKIIAAINQKREATTQEIAKICTDIPPATLYRHINRLYKDGILEVVSENNINGIMEKVYCIKDNPYDEASHIGKSNDPEQIMNLFVNFTLTMLSDFQNYTSRKEINLAEDGVGFKSSLLYLSDEELIEMAEDLWKCIEKMAYNAPSKERKLRRFSTIFVPLDENGEEK